MDTTQSAANSAMLTEKKAAEYVSVGMKVSFAVASIQCSEASEAGDARSGIGLYSHT